MASANTICWALCNFFFLARHTISFYSSSFRFPQKNVQWICFVYLFDQNGKKFPLVFLYWITKEMVSIWCKFSGLPLSWPFDGYSILCTIPFCSTHVCSIPVFFLRNSQWKAVGMWMLDRVRLTCISNLSKGLLSLVFVCRGL